MAISEIKSIRTNLKRALDYYMNPLKTEGGDLVTGINCTPEIAYEQFVATKRLYDKEDKILAYRFHQSFVPGEITKEMAHEIGINTAKHLLGNNKYEIVVSTHVDKNHIHNHVCFNSVSCSTGEKYDEPFSAMKLRAINDRLCREYGLSVIEYPKQKGMSYKEWMEDKRGMSWKTQIRNDIDRILSHTENFEQFINRMRQAGYEVKRGKYTAYRPPGKERFVRGKTLGAGYTDDSIQSKIIISQLGGKILFSTEKERTRSKNIYRPNIKNAKKQSVFGLLAVNFMLSITILKALSGRLQNSAYKNIKKPQLKPYEQKAVDARIRMLANQLFLIHKEKINGRKDLSEKITAADYQLRESRQKLKDVESVLKNMEPVMDAMENLNKYGPIARQAENGFMRKKTAEKYESELRIYHFALSQLLNAGIANSQDMTKFIQNYDEQKKILELSKRDYGQAKARTAQLHELYDSSKDLFEIKYVIGKEARQQYPDGSQEKPKKKGR